jgi:hypothetical protein
LSARRSGSSASAAVVRERATLAGARDVDERPEIAGGRERERAGAGDDQAQALVRHVG